MQKFVMPDGRITQGTTTIELDAELQMATGTLSVKSWPNHTPIGSNSRKVNGFSISDSHLSELSDYGSYDGAERRKRLN